MSRTARQASATGIYHITTRGAGRHSIFEDDADKARFMHKLEELCPACGIDLLAWCLMDNHFHLLLRGDLNDISHLMRRINTSLAHWYNGRHGHIGPVIQGRFSSVPVESDARLLEVVRYIHLNPRDRDCGDFRDYEWSSYRQYANPEGIHPVKCCETAFVLGVFDGVAQFRAFHEIGNDAVAILEEKPQRPRISDAEAREIAIKFCGESFGDKIAASSKQERDKAIVRLYAMGVSIRQLERLTGIGRGIIQTAVKKGR